MRPFAIVFDAPLLDLVARAAERDENVFIEALLAQLTVEALDEGVLNRLARLDELQLHAARERLFRRSAGRSRSRAPTPDLPCAARRSTVSVRSARFRDTLLHDQAAVRMENRTGKVAALLARQKQCGVRNVDRLADSAQRRMTDHPAEICAFPQILGHRRVDYAGTNRVAVYIETAEFERHVLHQHPDARLADGIFARSLDRNLRRARRDRDNLAAVALRDHLFGRSLAAQEAAVEIYRHQPAPFFERNFMQQLVDDLALAVTRVRDARRGQQNIQPTQFRDGPGDHRIDLRRIAHVNLNRDRLASELADRGGGFFGLRGLTVGDGDIGALFGETDRAGAADATGAPGDQGVFALQSETHRKKILRITALVRMAAVARNL